MNVTDKKPRLRSPAYPSMGLPSAIVQAKVLYEKEGQGRHPIPAMSIAKDWDYSSLNGSALTAISALKQYGLLEELEVEEGKPRKLKLTHQALNLVVRSPESTEWKETAKKAALQPKLYERLWQKYNWPLPSDGTVKTYLELDEQYNAKFIDSIIKDYKATIALAKLAPSDKIADVGGGENDDESPNDVGEEGGDMENPAIQDQKKGNPPPPPGSPTKQYTYTVDTGDAVFRWPAVLSAEDCEGIEAWLETLKAKIKRSVTPPSEN